jgi:uncharacterized protein (DUF885 family)
MTFAEECRAIIETKGSRPDPERLRDLFDAAWAWQMEVHPEFATYVGYPGHNDRWTDASLEAIEERQSLTQTTIEGLDSIDTTALGPGDLLDYQLFRRQAEESLEEHRFHSEYLMLGPFGGPESHMAQLIAMMPASKPDHFSDLVARLDGIATALDQTQILLREGISAGITSPRVVLRGVPDQISAQLVEDPLTSPLLEPFAKAAEEGVETDRLKREAASIYQSKIRPALERYREMITGEYIPAAREVIAHREQPNGEEWYEFLVAKYTTTKLSPKEIHEIGQEEVARLRKLMDEVISSSGFSGSFDRFTDFLRTDRRFYFEDAEDLLRSYRDICKRADPQLARLFGKLPRLPYGVLPVPAYIEKTATTAYYQPGSPEAGRAGYFYANTYDLDSRPKWEMEALTLHEAVPGHHLQIALSQELEGLPEFRKHFNATAYIEGWGLYAESLGEEMDFYQDPYSKFGQLTYEMWRAIRLVVDTGMHAVGWGRDEAIEFFKANTGKTEHDIVVEVDRYISWPGQALAYKVGEIKLKELRARASAELGDAFDIRAFHDQVLGQGAMPLDVLEGRIDDWIRDTGK